MIITVTSKASSFVISLTPEPAICCLMATPFLQMWHAFGVWYLSHSYYQQCDLSSSVHRFHICSTSSHGNIQSLSSSIAVTCACFISSVSVVVLPAVHLSVLLPIALLSYSIIAVAGVCSYSKKKAF